MLCAPRQRSLAPRSDDDDVDEEEEDEDEDATEEEGIPAPMGKRNPSVATGKPGELIILFSFSCHAFGVCHATFPPTLSSAAFAPLAAVGGGDDDDDDDDDDEYDEDDDVDDDEPVAAHKTVSLHWGA